MFYRLLSLLFLTIFMVLPSVQSSAKDGKDGGASGGGGDLMKLEAFANLVPDQRGDVRTFYRDWFVRAGLDGLALLEPLAWMGYEFKDSKALTHTLAPLQVRMARSILRILSKGEIQSHFTLDRTLMDPLTHVPRLAQNGPGAHVTINPEEWDSTLRARYSQSRADAIRMSIAVHEILSQPEIGLESTGNFTYSAALLKSFEFTPEQKKHYGVVQGLFGLPESSGFISCDVNLYQNTPAGWTEVWRAPIPLRSYMKAGYSPRHIETLDGRGYDVKRSFIPTTANGCFSEALYSVGLVDKPMILSYEALKFLPSIDPLPGVEDRVTKLDICYVLGDPDGLVDYDGAARLMLRKIDPSDKNSWHHFDYLGPERSILGKGEVEIPFDEDHYKVKVYCERLAPLQ